MGKILKIREIGDPVLSKKSSEIDVRNINSEVIDIIEDLKATLEFGYSIWGLYEYSNYKRESRTI